MELNNYNTIEYSSMQHKLDLISEDMKKVADSIFDNSINTPKTIKLFKDAYTSNDSQKSILREKLYTHLKKSYMNFKKYGIQQLHFHLPNNDSFLRFHKLEKFGDNLTKVRDSVKYVNQFKKPIVGFEEGKIFNGYRYVYPLFDEEKKHIGSVEISSSLLSFKKSYKQENNLHLDYILTKDIVHEKVFESELKNYETYPFLDDFYIQKTIQNYNDKVCQHKEVNKKILTNLVADLEFKEKVKKFETQHYNRFIDRELYTLYFIPLLNDFNKQKVGYIIIYVKSQYLDYFLISILISFLFIFIFSVFLWFILHVKDKNIIQMEEKLLLKKELHTDELTNALNRKDYNKNIEKLFYTFQRYNTPFSVMMFDIDNFKQVNDTYGHSVGDDVLKELATLIQLNIRESDYLFRVGGEEFIVLFTKTKVVAAKQVAEKIKDNVEFNLNTINDRTITISIGLTEVERQDTQEALYKRVDELLYKSKNNGKNMITTDGSDSRHLRVVLDSQANIVEFECTFVQHDYPYSDVIGKNWFSTFINSDNKEEVLKVFQSLLYNQTTKWKTYDNEVVLLDGTPIRLNFTNKPFIKGGKKFISSFGVESS